MASQSERESTQSGEQYSHKKVFEGVGHLVYTDYGVFLVPGSQPLESPHFDPPILDKKIGMVELFEGVSGQLEFRITVEYKPLRQEPKT